MNDVNNIVSPCERDYLAEWLVALRSDKYKQGKGALKLSFQKEDRFCCMGVLCDVVDTTKWSKSKTYTDTLLYGDTKCDIFPPANIRIIPKDQLTQSHRSIMYALAGFNDDSGYDFKKIADWIQEHVERIEVTDVLIK